MGDNDRSRRDLMRDIAVAAPALGVGALLASGFLTLRQRTGTTDRDLDLTIEHRYPGWSDGDYGMEVVVATLVNQGSVAERDIRWQIRADARRGTELVSWNALELFRPAASTVTVEAPGTPSLAGPADIEAAVTSETPSESQSMTLFTVLVRRLDPGETVQLDATFRGELILITQEAQSRETAASGYLRVRPAFAATPAAT